MTLCPWGHKELDMTEGLSVSIMTYSARYLLGICKCKTLENQLAILCVSLILLEYRLPWLLRWENVCLQCRETQVRFLGQEDPPEKEMATHSSILAWKNPRD